MMGVHPLVTAVVPAFNEEGHLAECLRTLRAQTYSPLEIIVVDDGSRDSTATIAEQFGVRLLRQAHAGKARAVARGAEAAGGEILVFLDGDLVFAPEFLERLVGPIVAGECTGTSHGNEYVANEANVWSRCLQLTSGLPPDKRLELSDRQLAEGTPVYRAVRTEDFRRVGGFNDVGYLDDQSLAPKLGQLAKIVEGAVCYHYNPASLKEVFSMGAWKGKSIWYQRRWRGLWDHCPPRGVWRGIRAAAEHGFPPIAAYVWVLEWGIFWGVAKRFLLLDRTYGA